MESKPPIQRKERKKKGERKSKSQPDTDELEGIERPRPMAPGKVSRLNDDSMSSPVTIPSSMSPSGSRPTSSSASRPTSSHRSSHETKERVVRDTVSFNRPPPSDPPRHVRSTPSPVLPVTTTSADDYDDDFEDYDDDDFEDDEETTSAPTSAAPVPSSVPKLSISHAREDADMKALRHSVQQENSAAMERQQQARQSKATDIGLSKDRDERPKSDAKGTQGLAESKGTEGATTQRRKKGHGLMGFNKASPVALGPRMKRLQKLRESGVLDMQDDKAVVLNIMPSTTYEVYHRKLFSQNPQIRQMGVPIDVSCRNMEVNTEEIEQHDKEVQYVYGDDTALINAMKRVAARRKGEMQDEEKAEEGDGSTQQREVGVGMDEGAANEIGNENRLNAFLQAAAQLCEDILDEESAGPQGDAAKRRNESPTSLFSRDMDWCTLGGDVSEGSNELVRNRTVSCVTFSSLQPHLLMTAHPYNETDDQDLRPFRGIFCVWSTAAPGSPSVVLEGSGQPSCCSFSSSQTFVVAGGTAEGTLHIWDLRESNSLHANRDTIDLRIAKGLRKPCYSTHSLGAGGSAEYMSGGTGYGSRSQESSELDLEQHACPIVQLESVSSAAGSTESWTSASAVSHFISLDSSGKAIIWVATQTTVSASESTIDYGLSPWGKVRLLKQRVLQSGLSDPGLDFGREVLPSADAVLGVIPGDTSCFLISSTGGAVKRIVRYGSEADRAVDRRGGGFGRPVQGSIVVDNVEDGDSKHDSADLFTTTGSGGLSVVHSFTPAATCIAVHPQKSTINHSSGIGRDHTTRHLPPMVLVGRVDGSLDLYSMDSTDPLQTWSDLSVFSLPQRESRRRDVESPIPVVHVQWAPWTAVASFFAVDSSGNIYYFDLTKNPDKPLFVERVEVSSLHHGSVRVSAYRNLGGCVYMAVGDPGVSLSSGALQIRKVSDSLPVIESGEANVGEEKDCSIGKVSLPPQCASWVGRTVASCVLTEYRDHDSAKIKTRK